MTRFITFLCMVYSLGLTPVSARAEVVYSQQLKSSELPIGNYLEWATSREIDVQTFVVEKSTDGINYNELGSVAGSGFSNVDLQYHFMDIGAADKKNYYRLKELTADGTVSFSQPAYVEKQMANNFTVVNMSSTDVSKMFKVTVDALVVTEIQCRLTDFKGKELIAFNKTTVNGLNDILVDLEAYPAGIYHLHFGKKDELESIVLRKIDGNEVERQPVASSRKNVKGRQ